MGSQRNKQGQSERNGSHSSEWLPHDWITEIRTRKNGTKEGAKYKCYTDPSTGKTFYSKPEVTRYLKGRQQTVSCSVQRMKGSFASTSTSVCSTNSVHPLESPMSDPELKEPRSQKLHQQKINSTKGSVYSKNSQKSDPVTNEVQRQKLPAGDTSATEVIVEKYVDGLPPGWIKEIRIKRSAGKVRKDPFYVDSASGYVFRSKVEVLCYLETGELSRHAHQRKTSSTVESNLTNEEASLPSTKRSKLAVSKCKQPFEGDGGTKNSPASALSKKGHAAVSSLEEGSEPMKDVTGEGKGGKSEKREKSLTERRNKHVLPLRSSKRLVGIKDEPVLHPKQSERVLRSKQNSMHQGNSSVGKSEDQIVDDDSCLNEESDFCFSSAIWTDDDPCLDLAIKSLTGAIPLDNKADDQLCSPPSVPNKKDMVLLDINKPPGSSKDHASPSSGQNNGKQLVIPGLLSLPVGSCSSQGNGSTIDPTTLDLGAPSGLSQKKVQSNLDVSESKQSDSRRKTRRKRML